jgi:hypothetical protein
LIVKFKIGDLARKNDTRILRGRWRFRPARGKFAVVSAKAIILENVVCPKV